MVVFAIVCGGLYRVWDLVYDLLPGTAYAAQAATTGLWMIAGVIVPYIVRRPGAALLAELIAAAIENMLGGQWGLSNMVSGLIQGIGSELVFLFFAYRRFNLLTCVLSGALASFAGVVQWYFQYGGDSMSAWVIFEYTVVALVSGAILGGWLPKSIGDALKRAGALRRFAIGQTDRTMAQ
jgi:energy-coupling factor transport system substrate-specific component